MPFLSFSAPSVSAGDDSAIVCIWEISVFTPAYIWAYDVNSKFGPYDGGGNWMGASTPDMMTTRITRGSTNETRVA